MGTLVKQFTYAAGAASSAQVNTNFDDIINCINNSLIWADGSKAMTAPLVLPGTDPVSDNQASRKVYVDTKAAAATAAAAAAQATANTANTTANAAALNKIAHSDFGNTSPASGTYLGGDWIIKAGHNLATVDVNGDFTVVWGTPFPTGVAVVVGTLVLGAGSINILQAGLATWAANPASVRFRIYNPATGASYTGGTADVSWVAIGW